MLPDRYCALEGPGTQASKTSNFVAGATAPSPTTIERAVFRKFERRRYLQWSGLWSEVEVKRNAEGEGCGRSRGGGHLERQSRHARSRSSRNRRGPAAAARRDPNGRDERVRRSPWRRAGSRSSPRSQAERASDRRAQSRGKHAPRALSSRPQRAKTHLMTPEKMSPAPGDPTRTRTSHHPAMLGVSHPGRVRFRGQRHAGRSRRATYGKFNRIMRARV